MNFHAKSSQDIGTILFASLQIKGQIEFLPFLIFFLRFY